jgi:hypothetical protein
MACFTVVRDVGFSDYMDVAFRNAINAGEVPGPIIAASGPALRIVTITPPIILLNQD